VKRAAALAAVLLQLLLGGGAAHADAPAASFTTPGCAGAPVWRIGYRVWGGASDPTNVEQSPPRLGSAELAYAENQVRLLAEQVGQMSACGVRISIDVYDFTGATWQLQTYRGSNGWLYDKVAADDPTFRTAGGYDTVFDSYPVANLLRGYLGVSYQSAGVALFPVIRGSYEPSYLVLMHEWLHQVVWFYSDVFLADRRRPRRLRARLHRLGVHGEPQLLHRSPPGEGGRERTAARDPAGRLDPRRDTGPSEAEAPGAPVARPAVQRQRLRPAVADRRERPPLQRHSSSRPSSRSRRIARRRRRPGSGSSTSTRPTAGSRRASRSRARRSTFHGRTGAVSLAQLAPDGLGPGGYRVAWTFAESPTVTGVSQSFDVLARPATLGSVTVPPRVSLGTLRNASVSIVFDRPAQINVRVDRLVGKRWRVVWWHFVDSQAQTSLPLAPFVTTSKGPQTGSYRILVSAQGSVSLHAPPSASFTLVR